MHYKMQVYAPQNVGHEKPDYPGNINWFLNKRKLILDTLRQYNIENHSDILHFDMFTHILFSEIRIGNPIPNSTFIQLTILTVLNNILLHLHE